MDKLPAVRTATGNEFQSVGAATEKARSPLDLRLDLGTSRIIMLAERRSLEGNACSCLLAAALR